MTELTADFDVTSSLHLNVGRDVSFLSTIHNKQYRPIKMFQEFKIAPDDVLPLRHFDETKMSFESFQFRKGGPKVRIPTYASQPHTYDGWNAEDDYESDEYYPTDSVTERPSDEGVQQRKRRRSDGEEEFIASDGILDTKKADEKGVKYWANQMMKWAKNPAVELQELTGWTYTPVSYSFVFLVGIGCGIMYHGWLIDLASDEVSYITNI